MVTHQDREKLSDKVEGSHGCGNGLMAGDTQPENCGCVSIICVRWEKESYNTQCKGYHARCEEANVDADDDVEVVVSPASTSLVFPVVRT